MQVTDHHAQTALDLFGEVTTETRARAKLINYQEAYGVSELPKALKAGQYPLPALSIFAGGN